MADVAPNRQKLRTKLGFGPRRGSAPGKLVKKSARLDDFEPKPDELKLVTDASRSASVSTIKPPKGLSKKSSFLGIPRSKSETPQPVQVQSRAPRKLSKLPHQVPVQPVLDKDTGERKDLTDMMHAFTYADSKDTSEESIRPVSPDYDTSRPDGAALLAKASPEIWVLIADFLSPLDLAHLSSTCRTVYSRLGRLPYKALRNPVNRAYRLDFLLPMDSKLPGHLFCFPCAQWHFRIQPGFETLKPHGVLNPLFQCPNVTNNIIPPPRLRISEGRTLPFTFVQLAKRSWAHGTAYGISAHSLSRRWKDPFSEWSHETMYHIHNNGHVLMRVKSQIFVHPGMTPAAKRLLLFSRGDYTPYFSVCAHWRKGVLTSIPKCALNHIPVPSINALTQLRTQKAPGPVSLCGECRPMRRCPECPTEYLVELKLVEDKNEKSFGPERFKQALLVTRWSDLGPARSPDDPEWAAIVGRGDGYDSFTEIGKRAISGIFESAFTDSLPGQRILSMNPKNVEADEEGGDWY